MPSAPILSSILAIRKLRAVLPNIEKFVCKKYSTPIFAPNLLSLCEIVSLSSASGSPSESLCNTVPPLNYIL